MKYSVIFDMDGVLVDSEPVIEAAAIAGLARFGVMADPEDFRPFIGAGEDKYIGGVSEKYGVPYKLEMKACVYDIYLEMVDSKLHIYEGVKELLHSLKNQDFKIALASSADLIKIDANLRVAGIDKSLFSAIMCGEEVVNKKPSPEIFLSAARKMGAEPQDCIVVEDAVNGIMAAKAAGMKCIAITSTFSEETLRRENPDHICGKTKDIEEILISLE